MKQDIRKISAIQLILLVSSFNVGMSLMIMIGPTIAKAHQNAWMAIAIATIASMLFTYLGTLLSRMYSEQSFVDCFKIVFGLVLGAPILLAYVLHWTVVTGLAVRQIVDFLMPALQLYETPTLLIILCILVLSAYAISGGIESLARSSEIIGPLVIPTLILVAALSFDPKNIVNLRPILQPHLLNSVFVSAVPATSFLTQTTIVMVIYPYLNNKKSDLGGVWGTGIAGAILMLTTLEAATIFGPNLPSKLWNPFFVLTRYISIADFIQNIDAIIVIIWFFSAFIRVAVYSWAAAQVATDLLHVNMRTSILGISTLALIVATLPPSIVVSTVEYPSKIVEPFVLPVLNVGLPLLGLGLAMLRRWTKQTVV